MATKCKLDQCNVQIGQKTMVDCRIPVRAPSLTSPTEECWRYDYMVYAPETGVKLGGLSVIQRFIVHIDVHGQLSTTNDISFCNDQGTPIYTHDFGMNFYELSSMWLNSVSSVTCRENWHKAVTSFVIRQYMQDNVAIPTTNMIKRAIKSNLYPIFKWSVAGNNSHDCKYSNYCSDITIGRPEWVHGNVSSEPT